jgi:hypothetical protein
MASPAYSLEVQDLELTSSAATSTGAEPVNLPSWLEPTLDTVEGLLRLPKNWDHRGAREISLAVAKHSLVLLGMTAPFRLPAPDVVPTVTGGLQFEWHQHNLDIELEVEPNLRTQLYWRDRTTAQEEEAELWFLRPVSLARLLEHLTTRHVGADAPAR